MAAQQPPQLPPIDQVAPFDVAELTLLRSMLRLATMRGAWQDEELEDVGRFIKRARDVLRRAEAGAMLTWKQPRPVKQRVQPIPEEEEEVKSD